MKTPVSNIPTKDRLNWIKANSKIVMELLLSLPPPTAATPPKTKSVKESPKTVSKQPSLPDIELPKFSTPDMSGLRRIFINYYDV